MMAQQRGAAPYVHNDDFPIVCVGGSAGGLDAYSRLLQHLPPDLGVAVVIVNQLRVVATMLHEILPRFTSMPVELITEGMPVRPNCVFIIPEKRDLHIVDGEFRLEPLSKPRGWPDVITVFLRSLAQHWRGKLIAVIVSGYDGDGADALCEIRDAGGVTIAQASATAGHARKRDSERLHRLRSISGEDCGPDRRDQRIGARKARINAKSYVARLALAL